MREAERLCDRVAIMHRGKILAEGSVAGFVTEHEGADLEECILLSDSRPGYRSDFELNKRSGDESA